MHAFVRWSIQSFQFLRRKKGLGIEGKTKVLHPLWPEAEVGVFATKPDITAGDGAKHDILFGKAELATRTTCNVFEYLQAHDIPVAYIGRDGPTTFLTRICEMIPVEVVVRRIAMGSYCKRHPDIKAGTVFEKPVIEFFYKTNGRKIGGRELPCDDPLMQWDPVNPGYHLYRPDQALKGGGLGPLNAYTSGDLHEVDLPLRNQLAECEVIAQDVNTHLRNAWQTLGGTLCDFKLEFGVLPDGTIVLADVVDCDSWRVDWEGMQLSKQGYRDGDDLGRVLGVYRLAASLTDGLLR